MAKERPNTVSRQARLNKILATLREQGNASFDYLARQLEVSEVTVRRDIEYMTSSPDYPFLQRIPKGVILLSHGMDLEFMFDLKLSINREAKEAIAKKAIELVDDGDFIVIDSGTTCLCISKLLHHRTNLSVLATDIKIAEELGHHGNINSNIICGEIRPGYYTIGGELALETLEKLHFQKAVVSADAIDADKGITNASMFEVGIKRRMIQCSSKAILVADSSKFPKVAMFKVCDLSAIDTIVTDRNLGQEQADRIHQLGIKLVLA